LLIVVDNTGIINDSQIHSSQMVFDDGWMDDNVKE